MYTLDAEYEKEYCKDIIKNNDEHVSYIRTVCYNVESILSKLSSMATNGNINSINEGCAYLNYLIHDKIKHINSSSVNIEGLYNAIYYYKVIYGLMEKCTNIEKFNISNDEFDKKKTLYFHTENLSLIENRYESISDSDHASYAKYFDECFKYYYQILQDEYCKKDKVYKNELNDFQKTFNKTKNFLKQQQINISIDDLQSTEEYNCSTEVLQPAPTTRGQGMLDAAMSDSLGARSPGQQAIGKDTPDINQSNISGIIGGTFLGTFALLLMSYKYTPFGPWLRQKKDVANNLFNNNEIRNHELLINNSENENINLDEQLYHIKYYSAENS
ncbi:PIR protein [Plasmodium ovale]|uniref:PIR protein n=1 Tax=Plasmodium ovale TaxID=36330 RepID=A0A1C3KIT1_PLAOA|nr:PIR protein [Plasmodium ovale]